MRSCGIPRRSAFIAVCIFGTIVPTLVFADDNPEHYSLEEVQACSGDAMRLCIDAFPDVHKIDACMEAKAKLSQLSKACQAMFAPGRKR